MAVRELLLERMHEQFRSMGTGGGVCVVSGSPGVGKTYLAEQFLQMLPESTPRLKSGGFRTGVAPLLPICDAIRSYHGGEGFDQLRAVAEEYSESVPLLKQFIAPLMRARSRTAYIRSDIRQAIPAESYTFLVFTKLFNSLADARPVVVFIDDIQWLDAASLGFLGYLARGLARHRIYLLLARRLNGREEEPVSLLLQTLQREVAGTVELTVDGITRSEMVVLLEALLGPISLTGSDIDWLERSSQGKPFYVRELVQLFRNNGRLASVNGTWRFTDLPHRPVVPPSMQEYVAEKLIRATEGNRLAKDAVQYAACAGTAFDSKLIANVLSENISSVRAALDGLERSTGLIKRKGKTTQYAFNHDLTREAVVAEAGDFATEMHARIAEKLSSDPAVPASFVAYQYSAAGDRLSAANWFAILLVQQH